MKSWWCAFPRRRRRRRVMEIFLPSPEVAVLSGGTRCGTQSTRVISPVESLQLVVKCDERAPGVKRRGWAGHAEGERFQRVMTAFRARSRGMDGGGVEGERRPPSGGRPSQAAATDSQKWPWAKRATSPSTGIARAMTRGAGTHLVDGFTVQYPVFPQRPTRRLAWICWVVRPSYWRHPRR